MPPRDQVYLTHDIVNLIKSHSLAILAAQVNVGSVEYCRGVMDLARALFMAFGVDWTEENNDDERT